MLATSQKQIDGLEMKGAHYLLEVDNPLVLPVNRKVRFLLTSDDVIHSWWVPDFAVKKDTIRVSSTRLGRELMSRVFIVVSVQSFVDELMALCQS